MESCGENSDKKNIGKIAYKMSTLKGFEGRKVYGLFTGLPETSLVTSLQTSQM